MNESELVSGCLHLSISIFPPPITTSDFTLFSSLHSTTCHSKEMLKFLDPGAGIVKKKVILLHPELCLSLERVPNQSQKIYSSPWRGAHCAQLKTEQRVIPLSLIRTERVNSPTTQTSPPSIHLNKATRASWS